MKTILAVLLLPTLIFAQEAEIKMLISPKKLEVAKKTLKIKAAEKPELRVCFFDTAGAELDAKKLILRVRLEEKANKAGEKDVDAVVKLRGTDKAPEGFKEMKPEADWVGPDVAKDVKPSFSIKEKELNEKMMRKVLAGEANVKTLLSDEQKKFAASSLKMKEEAFPWGKLRRYGVIEVWKSKRDVGTLEDVTVELWRLVMEGKEPLELLEISIKTKEGDPRPVADLAAEFYAAAEKAGFGKATGESKTQKVIEYYRPGK